MSETKYDTLSTESGDYKTTLNKMHSSRKPWKSANPNHIMSFMPGAVEELKVKVGDAVKEGQPLMVFRAMKMNNIMLSPASGKVKSINVKVGENLPKNALMIEIG